MLACISEGKKRGQSGYPNLLSWCVFVLTPNKCRLWPR